MEETRFVLYEFQSRKKPIGVRHEYTWHELCEKFREPIVTEESFDEYQAMTNEQKTEIKDVGGYVAGELKAGRRGKATLLNRQILAIDVDHAGKGKLPDVPPCKCIVHSTHSWTPSDQRYRWLFPLSRPVSATEYIYLANVVSKWVGADTVDESTDQPERLMFWPSVSFDVEYHFACNEVNDWIVPDDYLPADLEDGYETPKAAERQTGTLEIAEGQRNKTVFSFAATLRGQGLDQAGIREMLEQYNDRYCNPPLEGFELDTICRSVCSRYEPGAPIAASLRDAWDDFNDMGEWQETKPAPIKRLDAESMAGLGVRHVEAPVYVVDTLIANGITILASPPKFGKSWMCMDLAISVASGTEFMGLKTEKRGVIYLALEDGDYRLQIRGRKVAGERPLPDNLYLVKDAPILAEGLLPQLKALSDECGDVGMVIIDTLQKVRGVAGRTEGVYGYDYRELGQLHQYALANNLAVILVHHLNKGGDDSDFVGRLNGSTGISGAADSIITLSRSKRGDKETRMSITGRDIVERTLILEMDWGRYRWTILGEEHEIADRREELEFDNDPLVKTIRYRLDEAEDLVLDDPEASEVSWTCSSSELLDEVERLYGTQDSTPDAMGRKVKRLSEKLFAVGIEYKYERTKNRRVHVFTREII